MLTPEELTRWVLGDVYAERAEVGCDAGAFGCAWPMPKITTEVKSTEAKARCRFGIRIGALGELT